MLPFKDSHKDRFFYDKFEYCIRFFIEEASCLREINHEYVGKILDGRVQYKKDTNRFISRVPAMYQRHSRPITEKTRERLHEIVEILTRTDSDYKSVVSSDNMWVYTNDLELITELDDLDYLLFKKYTRAVINRPRGTILVKRSKFDKRTHLKSVGLTTEQSDKLRIFFLRNQQEIRLSPGLEEWCRGAYRRTMDYYFFDYSDEGWIMMISLINPGLVGKTLTIINE